MLMDCFRKDLTDRFSEKALRFMQKNSHGSIVCYYSPGRAIWVIVGCGGIHFRSFESYTVSDKAPQLEHAGSVLEAHLFSWGHVADSPV